MKVIIEFNTDNAAFQDDWKGQIEYLLEQTRLQLFGIGTPPHDLKKFVIGRLRDGNGNTVGHVRLEIKPPLVCSYCDTKHDTSEYENGDMCSHCGEELEE